MAKNCTARTVVALLIISLNLSVVNCDVQRSCHSTDNNPYLYFGTKTSYDTVRNPQGIPKVPECKPLQVWMIARHGAHWTRPTENQRFVKLMDLRDEILKNHERGSGALCEEDLTRLREWREYLISSDEADSLTQQGVRDSYSLGLRVRQALPALFENADPFKDFVFRHTKMDKTKQTAEYFVKGLFGIVLNPKFPDGLDDSALLEGFTNCPAWTLKNVKQQEKVDQFTRGPTMTEVYRNVSRRLGFNYNLPFYVVDAIYEWCVREKSVSLDSPAAWCAAFTAPELKAMEFLDDMQYYYTTGPGDRAGMNKKLGCPLVRDMLLRFGKIEENPDGQRPKGVFYFGEAETVGFVASRLGLLGERHSISSYISHRHQTFRTSALLPWGANIMAVFFQCSSGEPHRVMFLISEYIVQLPGCPSGLCPWSMVRHRLSSMENHGCSLQFCTSIPHSWIPLSSVEMWSILVFISTVIFIYQLFSITSRLTA